MSYNINNGLYLTTKQLHGVIENIYIIILVNINIYVSD